MPNSIDRTPSPCLRPTFAQVRKALKKKPGMFDYTAPERYWLTFPTQWKRRLKKDRRMREQGIPASTIDLLQVESICMEFEGNGHVPLTLVNRSELEKEVAKANGRRKQRGVLTMELVLERAKICTALTDCENWFLMASPIRNGRPVELVTGVVIMRLNEKQALGYATVLPKWSPVLAGAIIQRIPNYDFEELFPEASRHKDNYYARIRAETLAPEMPVNLPFEAPLDLM